MTNHTFGLPRRGAFAVAVLCATWLLTAVGMSGAGSPAWPSAAGGLAQSVKSDDSDGKSIVRVQAPAVLVLTERRVLKGVGHVPEDRKGDLAALVADPLPFPDSVSSQGYRGGLTTAPVRWQSRARLARAPPAVS